MVKEKYIPPKLGEGQFHCPHCEVFSKQEWAHIQASNQHQWSSLVDELTNFQDFLPRTWYISRCQHCTNIIIWTDQEIVYPKKIIVQLPNDDLHEDIQKDYLEAANVLNESPRAAAALLRLALQKLCVQLGGKGKNINDDIKALVSKGLNPLVQKSLDSLRITGNNAVHPGVINLEENHEIVMKLFQLINFIAEKMITEPKEISSFYDGLPDSAIEAIEKRDGESK